MQDFVGAFVVIGLLWLVIKLAFGGSSNQAVQGTGTSGTRGLNGSSGIGSKESAAAQAWRESKDERQHQLKRRKQEMIEQARRKLLEQDTGGSGKAATAHHNQPFASSSIVT